MSSTSAVAVLAQGLRELRDFAEGPDGEELQQQTGLTPEQIETALGGEELPTREVTLILVQAWEGDVEAWREYWGQISELAAEEDDAGTTKKTAAPTPPEPSIITPIAAAEPGSGVEVEGEQEGGSGEAEAVEAAEPSAEAESEQSAQAVTAAAERGEAERGEAKQAEAKQAEAEKAEAEKAEAEKAEAKQAEAKQAEAEKAEAAQVETKQAEAQQAETAQVETKQVEAERAEAERVEAEHEAARAEGDSGVVDAADAASGAVAVDGVAATKAQETVVAASAGVAGVAAEKSIPAQRSAESAEQAARTRPSAVVEGVVVAGGAVRPAKKGMGARVGIPVLLFAVGVGVGAFGDHALNSKQSSTDSTASVPPVSASSKSAHSAASSASSASAAATGPSATPSSGSSGGGASATDSAGVTGSDTGSSASTSSTVAPGTVLGNYVNIQLAAGYSVNFLSDPYHPVSGTAHGPDSMGFFADSFVDGRFYAPRAAVLNPTDTGSYTSCLNDTRYQTDVLLSQVSAGESFCITTDTGHLVLVSVKRMPSSTDANPYAVLDLTVWQGD